MQPTLASLMKKSEGFMIRLEKSLEICSLQEDVVVVVSGKTYSNKISMPMKFSECSLVVDYLTTVLVREGSARQQHSNKMLEAVTHIIPKDSKEDKERNKTQQRY